VGYPKVRIQETEDGDTKDLQRLMQYYFEAQEQTYPHEVTEQICACSTEKAIMERFMKVTPKARSSLCLRRSR
jgi:hypothetical protein